MRRQGIGKKMVQAIIALIPERYTVRAEIKVGNIASIKIADHVGMKLELEDKGIQYYVLVRRTK